VGVIVRDILIVGALILANALFALSEMAVVSARKVRLQRRAEEGDEGARAALELANAPNQFLSTVQIGITLVATLAGAFGGATLAAELARWLGRISFLADYSDALSLGLVVLVITYLSLVLGELVPKRMALSNAERIAAVVSPAMRTLSHIMSPFVRLLSLSTDGVLRLLRVRQLDDLPVTEDEVRLLIEQGTRVGVFEPSEQEMVGRVFRLDTRPVSALMTPRTEVVWLDLEEPVDELRQVILSSDYSVFPVARDTPDAIVGVVQAKDLLAQCLSGEPMDLEAVLRPAQYVPENMSLLDVLERLRDSHSQIALVIGEYGGFQGLVTLNDMLEAIVGDLPQLDDRGEPDVIEREDGSWLVDGRVLTDDLKVLLRVKELPGEASGGYRTVGGMVMTVLERVPIGGDYFEWGGLRFEVVDMDGFRVDKVLVTTVEKGVADGGGK
jgi:putative hemolysin